MKPKAQTRAALERRAIGIPFKRKKYLTQGYPLPFNRNNVTYAISLAKHTCIFVLQLRVLDCDIPAT